MSEKIGIAVAEIVKKLMMLGIMANINSTIDFDTAELVLSDFGVTLELNKAKTMEEQLEEKICSFCENAQISMSALQRVFKISFPFASRIVDLLLDKGIISRQEIGYKILDNIQLKTELQNQLKHLAE